MYLIVPCTKITDVQSMMPDLFVLFFCPLVPSKFLKESNFLLLIRLLVSSAFFERSIKTEITHFFSL